MDCRSFGPQPEAARGWALLMPRRGSSGVLGQATSPAAAAAWAAALNLPAGAELGLDGVSPWPVALAAPLPATRCLLRSMRMSSALLSRVLVNGTAESEALCVCCA